MQEKTYLDSFGNRSGDDVAENTLHYFVELFSLEMPLGRMMKMMPGMVKFALAGEDCRKDLFEFAPQMKPMMKKAILGK